MRYLIDIYFPFYGVWNLVLQNSQCSWHNYCQVKNVLVQCHWFHYRYWCVAFTLARKLKFVWCSNYILAYEAIQKVWASSPFPHVSRCFKFGRFDQICWKYRRTTINILILSRNFCTDRVATAQGKQGIWKSIFPDRENTGNLPKKIKNVFYTGNLTSTQGKFGGEKKKSNLSGLNYPLAVLCQDLGLWTFGYCFVNSWGGFWGGPIQAFVVHFGRSTMPGWYKVCQISEQQVHLQPLCCIWSSGCSFGFCIPVSSLQYQLIGKLLGSGSYPSR